MAIKTKRSEFKTFVDTAQSPSLPTYKLMGDGITTGAINYNPEVTTETYIHEDGATSELERYAPNMPVEAKYKKGDAALDFLEGLRKARAVGADAETTIVNVWLYENPNAGKYPAEQQRVSISFESFGGDGGAPNTLNCTLNYIGDAVIGTFNPSTKAFTPDPDDSE